jgi:hypothetical protein
MKLVAESGEIGNAEERELSPLKAATKQRLMKTEIFMPAIVTVSFGVSNSVRRSYLFVVTSVSVQ